MSAYQVVFIRHGQSTWNLENRFTGWTDVPLSDLGHEEACKAGQLLKSKGYQFDIAYASCLKRAIGTLWHVLEELDQMWIPVRNRWQLNERHYGALEGLNKAETAAQYSEEQVTIWRRGYAVRPPALERSDPRFPGHDRRYAKLPPEEIPLAESLADTQRRVVRLWQQEIIPAAREGSRILIAAHNNSLRALIKYLDSVDDEEIIRLSIPTGIPLVYEFDQEFRAVRHFYESDEPSIQRAAAAIASRGRKII